jgi:cysteine synthase A
MMSRELFTHVGRTPLVRLASLAQGLEAAVWVKLEYTNLLGSVKDRPALAIIQHAVWSGALKPGGLVVEATSGNMGIGLAFVCARLGFRLLLTMPENMSQERRKLLRHLGAELALTPAAGGMAGAVERAEEIAIATPGAYLARQFDNPVAAEAHRLTTGPEIWADTAGQVDIFIAGVGTGGTITGVGRALKSCKPAVRVLAVEPAASPVLSGGRPGPHAIQGIGAGFVPKIYDASVVDGVIQVSDSAALEHGRMLARREGLLAGISSGAAVCAALEQARLPENAGKTIVTILPSTGERYLSTALFND